MRILAHNSNSFYIYINHVCQLIECVMKVRRMWVTWSAVIEMECSLCLIFNTQWVRKNILKNGKELLLG